MYLVHQTARDLATYGMSVTQGGKRIDPMSVYAQPEQERNFCSRCGKRTNDIHTCTPPQKNT